jgi:glycerol-3-phosphate dehydrogenase
MARPTEDRQGRLSTAAGVEFDVCVIGGGATGAGCALDAQTRGLKTLLVEAGDFSSATSSASTKLVHGGVRYLQQAVTQLDAGQYHVVRRALRERIVMIANAPYLAHPMRFVIPCTNWFQAIYYGFGMKLYEWVSGKASLFTSHFYSRAVLGERVPHLLSEQFVGGVVYADGQFDDARFNLMLVKTFSEAGGTALNYARVESFRKTPEGRIMGAVATDKLTGQPFEIRARCFVNATGPFADQLRQQARPDAPERLRVSRGSHILVPIEKMPSPDALMIPKTADGRLIFVIPWLGSLLIGTTDDESTVADDLMIKPAEIDYLLSYANQYLDSRITRDDIRACFVGLRPLVRPAHDSRAATKKLIRDHEVEVDTASGLVNILGGKWTTYRAMAEDTIDAVQKRLGVPAKGCKTASMQLAGSESYGAEYAARLAAAHGLSEAVANHLAGKFGTRAARVLQLAQEDGSLSELLVAGHPILRAEVVYSIREEMACSIEDVLARRVGLQFVDCRAALEAAPAVARYLASELGWDAAAESAAVSRYQEKIRNGLENAGLAPA